MKYITTSVWILSLVSLFTDIATEMLYPILPIYLQSIGFSIVYIGILEGIAEATAGLSKGYFGILSDTLQKRVPFVQMGYACSAIAKPLLALFTFPLWIFFVRTIDRFGKGIRSAARDALLANESTPNTKARVFGFHRSMDTLGAVIGPCLALLYVYYYPSKYVNLLLIAGIPGLFAIISSLFLKRENSVAKKVTVQPHYFSFFNYWKKSPITYKKLVYGLLAFTLINSSDVFLLLQVKQLGLNDRQVIVMYIFYNLVYALLAFPMGILADKIGIKPILIVGLMAFAGVYFGISVNTNQYFFYGLFLLYGIYASATEGISKAWIAKIIDKNNIASAIGTFSGFQSICTMVASSLTGLIWFRFGASVAFTVTAVATLVIILYFISLPNPTREITKN